MGLHDEEGLDSVGFDVEHAVKEEWWKILAETLEEDSGDGFKEGRMT